MKTEASARVAPRLVDLPGRARRGVRRAAVKLGRAMRPSLPPFPPDFLFGSGTSDHQCEAFDPRFPDVWDAWEAAHPPRVPGVVPHVARGRATDFWNRYPEDVRLARSLGCKAFRFSIAWARVEPGPGRFSEAALRHYRALAEAVCEAGMEPLVTLMHFVWPKHVEDHGGLRAAEFPNWFAAYTERVRDALGDLCRYWITINEPNALLFGYLKPFWMRAYAWPPGLPPGVEEEESMRATAEVIRNLFLAHRAARLALRAGPAGERRLVSANSYYLGLPTHFWRLPLPLMQFVIENGFAGHPQEISRARNLRAHLRQLQRARADGVNVIGYLAWSLTTNREWGLPPGPHADFGLFHIDLDGDPTLARRSTPAAATYKSIVHHRRA